MTNWLIKMNTISLLKYHGNLTACPYKQGRKTSSLHLSGQCIRGRIPSVCLSPTTKHVHSPGASPLTLVPRTPRNDRFKTAQDDAASHNVTRRFRLELSGAQPRNRSQTHHSTTDHQSSVKVQLFHAGLDGRNTKNDIPKGLHIDDAVISGKM